MQGQLDLVGKEDDTGGPAFAGHLLSAVPCQAGGVCPDALEPSAGLVVRGSWQAWGAVSAGGTFGKPIPSRVNVPLVLCNLCHQVEGGRPEPHSERTQSSWPVA